MMEPGLIAELESVRVQNGGVLRPEDVVEFARDPKTALHKKFEWDDTEAARLYRLEEARGIIRVAVSVVHEDFAPMRTYVSLSRDRVRGGGYRPVRDVLNHDDMRKELLSEAISELARVRARYMVLNELTRVFEEIDAVAEKFGSGKRKSAAV